MATLSKNYHIFEAAKAITSDPVADRVFRELLGGRSSSGWALAKTLTLDPREALQKIEDLLRWGVIGAEGSDLDAFYYVTTAGFEVWNLLR